MFLRLLICSVLIVIVLPALAQSGPIARTKLGDNDLTCRQIYDEVKQMESIAANAQGSRTQGQDVAVGAAVLPYIPFIGWFASAMGSAANTAAANNSLNTTERIQQAAVRQDHLTNLFNVKGCKLSEIETGRQVESRPPGQPPRADQAPSTPGTVAESQGSPAITSPPLPAAAQIQPESTDGVKVDQQSTTK